MRFTILFVQASVVLLLLLLWSGGAPWVATLLVWTVLAGLAVFLLEAVLTLCGAVGFFANCHKDGSR